MSPANKTNETVLAVLVSPTGKYRSVKVMR